MFGRHRVRAILCAGIWGLAGVAVAGVPIAREKWSVALLGGGNRIFGESGLKSSTGPSLHLLMLQRFSPKLSVGIKMGYTELDGTTSSGQDFFTELLNMDLIAQYKPIAFDRLRPMVNAGAGLFNFQYLNGDRFFDGEFILGAGLEFIVNRQWSLQLSANHHWTTGKDLDGPGGTARNSYLGITGGVVWNIGERLFAGGAPRPELPAEIAEAQITGPETGREDTVMSKVRVAVPAGSLADSVRIRLQELERRIQAQEQKVETLRRVVEEKREQVARLEQEIAELESRISSGQTGDFEDRYKKALQLYLDHQNEEAIRAFSALVRDFPNHRYVSNCHYWIGEAYFALGDYQQAIISFERVLNYQKSPKLDDALLMLGRSYLKIGDSNQARYYLSRLVSEFPDSEYVEKAKRYLASVK